MKTPLRTKLAVALALATLIVAAALWRTYRSADSLVTTVEWVDRNRAVLTQLNALLATLESLESLQRAYLLTGQPEHLRDYRAAAGGLEPEYERLRDLVRPIPETHRLVLQLRPLLEERAAALASVIELYESEGLDAAQARIGLGAGTELMNEIRARIRAIDEQERSHLAELVAESRVNTRATEWSLFVSALGTLLLLALGGIITVRDLRRRERVEAELREANAIAEEAIEARTRFLATVSHEVRTPLNAIIGMTDLLRNNVANSEQAELTRAVYTNAEALLHLINDLLDSSKIEAAQVDLERLPVSVRDVVEGVAEVLAVRAAAKGVELVTLVEPSVPPRLLGDPNRIWQVLMNLGGNAVKFTDEGEVSIRAAARPLEGLSERVELTLEVADTGIGIPPEDQERVFERFVQADASSVRRYGGTGLGLSIARALVGLMGGRLELDSAVGQGSTFRLVLPLEVHEEGDAEGRDGRLGGLRVLVDVPNERSREAVLAMLTEAGATAAATSDGAGALPEEPTRWDAVVATLETHGAEGSGTADEGAHDGEPPGLVCLVAVDAPTFRRRPGPGRRVDYVFRPVKKGRLVEAVLAVTGQLPAPPPDPHSRLPAPQGSGLVRSRILVAEDNRDNWSFLLRVLRGAGYDADVAENGLEAVERVRRERYDLVLMDLEMPVMDGFEATERIRELGTPRAGLPIVALTAHAVEGFRERCLASGMDDYATKPMKQQQLLGLVRKWVDPRPLLLVADDSPDNIMVVQKFLGDEPVRLLTAGNGSEALEAFRRHRVSLVLLDMDMPVMDGYAAARAIRQTPEGRAVPILALTGYDGPEERAKCLEAGCTGHLAKPLRRAAFVRAVREALGPHGDPTPPAAHAPPVPAPAPKSGAEPGLPPVLPGGPGSGPHEQVGPLRRLIEQRRMGAAAERVRALRSELATPGLPEGTPETLRLADELLKAVEDERETSAAFWADRLADALREADRLVALRRAERLTASPNATLDRLTRLASRVLGTPVSLISLVGEHGQFFASQCGVEEPWASRRGTPLSLSFCKHIVHSGEPLVVGDARRDPLVSSNRAVTELNAIAYAGYPLVTSGGHVLGSFCVIDHEPRTWTDEDLAVVGDLAALAVHEIESRARAASEPPTPELAPRGEDEGSAAPAFGARFVEARRSDAAQARRLLAGGSFREIARLGHQWKGSSAILGFPEVGKIGSELERAAQEEDPARVGAALDLLEEHLERVAQDAAPR